MNCNELKLKLNQKDAELKSVNEKTIEIFNLIKDDCLNHVINEVIKYNFDRKVNLFAYQIMDFIQERLNINFGSVRFNDYFVHGVESAYLDIDFPIMGLFLSHNDFNSEDEFKEYHDSVEKERKYWNDALEFSKTFDWARLCVMIRAHIISNGFNGVVATHRYTGEKCNLMKFKTTREKLVRSQCCKTKTEESVVDESNNIYPIIAVVGFLIVIALYYLIR